MILISGRYTKKLIQMPFQECINFGVKSSNKIVHRHSSQTFMENQMCYGNLLGNIQTGLGQAVQLDHRYNNSLTIENFNY